MYMCTCNEEQTIILIHLQALYVQNNVTRKQTIQKQNKTRMNEACKSSKKGAWGARVFIHGF